MMPLSRKIAVALVGVGVAVIGAWSLLARPRPTRPIDAVPSDAFVAIEVDVASLRKSGALASLFGNRDEQKLTQVCGFDPVDEMQDLVFTIPEGGDGDFGVAVQANINRDDLIRCADEVVKAHGGDPTPDTTSRGSYAIITPRRTSAESTRPPRSIAYHKGGPILVGPKRWLYSMIDALDAAGEGRDSPGEHLSLRTALAKDINPPPTFLVTGTVLIEPSVRSKLRTEMLAEVGGVDDPGTSMMLGVLGMSSGAIGLYERGDDVHAVLDLRCEEEAQCAQVEKLVAKVRGEWSKMPALREFGLGPVLDRLEVDHHGTTLQVRTAAATTDVLRWAKLFLASRPVVASPDGGVADVPTETLRVTVPEGVKPGQPFSVKIPGTTSGSAATGVRSLPATVPAPKPSASAVHP
jgi:hypothetical protein